MTTNDYETTRRGVITSFGAALPALGILDDYDEDDDGHIIDDLLGLDESGGSDDLYIIRITEDEAAEHDEPAHERIAPSDTPSMLVEPDGSVYTWDTEKEVWRWYVSTGESPELAQPKIDKLGQDLDVNGHDLTNVGASHIESLGTTADHIVNSKSKLQTAFSNLSAGDTIWIETPDTPYRTDSWLDIDVDGVTVEAPSPYADDGNAIIKPADGADVGGIRIGNSASVTGVTVRNVGFDGNDTTMTASVKRLHGIVVDDATDVTIENCYVTRTHPYHEHDSGGSGVSVRTAASNVRVLNNRIDDIGDRGIQAAGDDMLIEGNICTNGYDRHIALDVKQPDGNWYVASDTIVSNNLLKTNSDGSNIGMRGGGDQAAAGEQLTNITISENRTNGGKKGVLVYQMDGSDGPIKIVDNDLRGGTQAGVECSAASGSPAVPVTISDNSIDGFGDDGVVVGVDKVSVSSNQIVNCTAIGIDTGSAHLAIEDNQIHDNGGTGIDATGSDCTISGNNLTGNAGDGIHSLAGNSAISDNYAKGNDAHGINIAGAAKQVVKGNVCFQNNAASGGSEEIRVNNTGTVCTDNHLTSGGPPDVYVVTSSASDVEITDRSINRTDVNDSGTRTVINGVGLNAGDPSSTGDWNTNGREGVNVRDTSNSDTYLYNNGSWSQIASA